MKHQPQNISNTRDVEKTIDAETSTFSTGPTVGRRGILTAGLAAALLPLAGKAQQFSAKPIRLVVGASPGGSNDLAARIVAQHLGEALKTTVIVENKAGVMGLLAYDQVKQAPPDGHTLLISSASPVAIAPQTIPKSTYSPTNDLISIETFGLMPQAIVVRPSLGVRTLKDFLALARTQKITLASPGTGGMSHLTIELLSQASNASFVHVPYKGGAPAVTDVLAGHVDGMVSDLPPMLTFMQDGRLVTLAVTSEKRSELLPDAPSAGDVLPGFDASNWMALFAPANTPKPIVDKLHDVIKKLGEHADFRGQLLKGGIVPTSKASCAESQKFFASEVARWGNIVREKKIVVQ